MPRHRFTYVVIAATALVLAAGYSVSAAKKTPKQGIDWAAMNPAFAGATFVNDPATCRTCHEDTLHGYTATIHARTFSAKPPEGTGECESCHGPRSKHVENPTAELAFTKLTTDRQSAVCLQCHENSTRIGFTGGAHHNGSVSCASCHAVMTPRSEHALLKTASQQELCYTCHADVRGQMFKASHHPVREGRMECSSCHNPHGSQPSLLKRGSLNETCTSCHTEKRGPFVWEHAPVRESCANCHEPHGANNRNLLTRKDPFLCMSCHSYGGHINLPRYNRVGSSYGSGCVNCHITTHGSNHPSGAKQTR